MPKKQIYSPVNIAVDAESSSQHHFTQYRDDPDHDPEQGSSMPTSGASIKSALSKKSRKSRRRVDNDELSVPLHALSEGGGDDGDGHDVDVDVESGVRGAAVSLEDDPFYVFREDLTRKLCLADEGLKRFLNVIHDTVSFIILTFVGTRGRRYVRRSPFVIAFTHILCWVLFYCYYQTNHGQFIIKRPSGYRRQYARGEGREEAAEAAH